MLSAIRRRLHLTPSALIATLALVFAMSGGAYAAGKYLITSTKQISPKVLKSLQGKAGTSGAQGALGASGPAGAAGATGVQGPTGATGPQGPAGEKGEKGEKGTKGANGTNGAIHPGETLPPDASETGVWLNTSTPATQQSTQLSFTIPLAESLTWGEGLPGEPENQVHYINELGNEVPTVGTELASHPACPGTVERPEATPGNLCIYAFVASPTGQNENITNPAHGGSGAATTGALLDAPESRGTWVVTAK
jgi:hypothetical protein